MILNIGWARSWIKSALICTTPEFDDLRTELLESKLMSLDSNREQIRAELDAIIAHLYSLTEDLLRQNTKWCGGLYSVATFCTSAIP